MLVAWGDILCSPQSLPTAPHYPWHLPPPWRSLRASRSGAPRCTAPPGSRIDGYAGGSNPMKLNEASRLFQALPAFPVLPGFPRKPNETEENRPEGPIPRWHSEGGLHWEGPRQLTTRSAFFFVDECVSFRGGSSRTHWQKHMPLASGKAAVLRLLRAASCQYTSLSDVRSNRQSLECSCFVTKPYEFFVCLGDPPKWCLSSWLSN